MSRPQSFAEGNLPLSMLRERVDGWIDGHLAN
jgi:hypothetical protein